MKVFFDGGCRPLPAGMELAVVAGGRTLVSQGLGPGTSTAAEWLALIAAARLARELGLADPLFLGDAAAVVAQASGAARCPAAHAGHRAAFLALVGPARPRLRRVGRSRNLAGIALARLHGR